MWNPRVGGEKADTDTQTYHQLESPPRRRGKGLLGGGLAGLGGITPAWAGKSQGDRADRGAEQDHPRTGGEKKCDQQQSRAGQGSPPHRRGKECVDAASEVDRGITPAQAGKRSGRFPAGPRRWDHPRVGGEKRSACSVGPVRWGSPPHGRGKAPGVQKRHSAGGITPAWAGKSLFCFAAAVPIQDHPRVGGEKLYCIAAFCSMWGSPPHGRGKATWHCVRRPALRITPAHAWKRTRSWRAYGCPWDHPRTGGKRQPRRPSSRDRRDHPRVGGEKSLHSGQ